MNEFGAGSIRASWDCKDDTVIIFEVSNPGRELTDGECRVYQVLSDLIDDTMRGEPREMVPSFGSIVLYRETSVRPGNEVEDSTHLAVVVQVIDHDDGNRSVCIRTEDAAMSGCVHRWRPAKARPGDGTYGWCWPHEADLPPTVEAMPS